MADKKTYQVQSACVVVPIVNSDGDRYMSTLYGGNVFDADPDEERIKYNLESGYIVELGANSTAGVDGAGVPVIDDKRLDGSDVGAPVDLNDPGVVNARAQQAAQANADAQVSEQPAQDGQPAAETPSAAAVSAEAASTEPAATSDVDAERQAAQEKLATLDGAPDGRQSKAVLVEYLAAKGYDYAELSKQEKPALLDLVKQNA